MTLHPQQQWTIPPETARVASCCFPQGNVYMKMSEQLGQIYSDSDFQSLYPVHCGQSALSPARLALITVMQFAENLTDRQAADAVRSRIDWKYALGLELTDSGFNHSVLPEFRARLIASGQEKQVLDLILEKLLEQKLLKARGKQRTDSTHILAAIRRLNRLELVGETLRQALNELALYAPNWLLKQVSQDWFDRYETRFEQYRLPKNKSEQEQLALSVGGDGHYILEAVYEPTTDPKLRDLPGVKILRSVWVQQYAFVASRLVWRQPEATGVPPHKLLIESPYDPEARNSTKRETNWTGYKVHLTETCDEGTPHLIINVETTPATTPDGNLTQTIHASLAQKDLLPKEHLLDTAYVDAEHLVTSIAEYQVNLIGKVPPDTSWQARDEQGLDVSCFAIDWDNKCVKCPIGQWSRSWLQTTDSGQPVVEVRFDQKVCTVCPVRTNCTQSQKHPRKLKLQPRPFHQALQAARTRQASSEFKQEYALRAGVEATISQGIRGFDLRRSRYFGAAKTHLQHIAIAAAINISRLFAWWQEIPVVHKRPSRFAALKATTAFS